METSQEEMDLDKQQCWQTGSLWSHGSTGFKQPLIKNALDLNPWAPLSSSIGSLKPDAEINGACPWRLLASASEGFTGAFLPVSLILSILKWAVKLWCNVGSRNLAAGDRRLTLSLSVRPPTPLLDYDQMASNQFMGPKEISITQTISTLVVYFGGSISV